MLNGLLNFKTSEKTLPVCFPPPIVDYLHFAHYLSILLSSKKHLNWFYANFIHILYNKKADQKLNFYMPNQFDCHPSFFIDTYRMHQDILNIDKIEIIKDIIRWIDNGFYVKLNVDSRLIPNNYMYKVDKAFLLPVFIYGYNKRKRVFYTHNFLLNRTYAVLEVSFDDIEKAFYAESSRKTINSVAYTKKREQAEDYFIILYKLNTELKDYYDFPFYLDKIRESLELYIKGESVLSANNEIVRLNDLMDYHAEDCYWGIHAYDGIKNNLQFIYNIYHGLFEHKNIMMKRLDFLREKGVLKTDEFAQQYQEVVNTADQLRKYCIKRDLIAKNSQNDNASADKAIRLLDKIKEKERVILSSVIESLDSARDIPVCREKTSMK